MIEQRKVVFIFSGAGGGNYGWAYQDTIPEGAKLTENGNSQVLSLQSR